MTCVAFTTQTPRAPTSSPSSSTASAVIMLTRRCGPARTSTTATTASRSTRVTIPANRLRADWATIGRSAVVRRRSASSRLDLGQRDEPLPAAGADRTLIRPSASQRRTVSTPTPSSSAASPIRR